MLEIKCCFVSVEWTRSCRISRNTPGFYIALDIHTAETMNDLKSLATYLNVPVAKLSLDQKEKVRNNEWIDSDVETMQ